MSRGTFCAAVVATMLALPAAANAANVYQVQSSYKSNVRYVDTRGESNTVVAKVIMDGYGVIVTDSTATITTVAPQDVALSNQPCTLLDQHRALCVNPTPQPEEIGGLAHAFLDMSLGAGDNAFKLDRESIAPEENITTAGGDDVISTGAVVSAFVSDFDGSNTIRVGRTERPAQVIGGRGPDRIDVKNGTGGDHVECSWLDEILPEGDRLDADRDDVVDADCG